MSGGSEGEEKSVFTKAATKGSSFRLVERLVEGLENWGSGKAGQVLALLWPELRS